MGREVGGGIGMGKTCEPKAFSFQCMTEFTTNKKNNNNKIKWHSGGGSVSKSCPALVTPWTVAH